jgi:lysozyme
MIGMNSNLLSSSVLVLNRHYMAIHLVPLRQALLLLNRDMASAVAAVNAVAAPNLTQAQLDAIYDLVFNAGAGVISAATGTGQALREGDVTALRYKLGRFIFQGGKILLGLRRRAAGRQALFDGKSWQEAEAIGRAVR